MSLRNASNQARARVLRSSIRVTSIEFQPCSVIARSEATKQSMLPHSPIDGLLRFAGNDDLWFCYPCGPKYVQLSLQLSLKTLTRVILPACCTRSKMNREMFSSVGIPSASTLLRSLWSSVLRTSSMLRSSRPRSTTMPVCGSGVPRTLTSARNEWPWISSLAAPKVVPLRECAASKRNDFVSSHILKIWFLSDAKLSDAECLVCLQAESPLRMAQAVVD